MEGSKRTSRPRGSGEAEGDAGSSCDSDQGHDNEKDSGEGLRPHASDVPELTTAGDRPTAHPCDLKEALLPELRRLFGAGDYETPLPMAERLLAANPDDEKSAPWSRSGVRA